MADSSAAGTSLCSPLQRLHQARSAEGVTAAERHWLTDQPKADPAVQQVFREAFRLDPWFLFHEDKPFNSLGIDGYARCLLLTMRGGQLTSNRGLEGTNQWKC